MSADRENFTNTYANAEYADAYSRLEWGGTYYLVYRDLPDIIRRHVRGRRALDFGCGTGRSTRLLRSYGFDVVGIDISESMLERARERDPKGDYRLIDVADLAAAAAGSFDVVLACFPFDNVPAEQKPRALKAITQLLAPNARFVNIVSDPAIYTNEWATFTTRNFPENKEARSGDVVRIITTDFANGVPVEDVLCTDAAYRELYEDAGLAVEGMYKPLGYATDPVAWVSEREIAPWVIYVLKCS